MQETFESNQLNTLVMEYVKQYGLKNLYVVLI